jgi:hypothetical protein
MEMQGPEPQRESKQKIKSPLPQLPAPNKTSIANQVCWYMGGLMMALGIVGYVVPNLFQAHLNPVHNLILVVSGALALWFGLNAVDYNAKKFSYWFGGVYMLLGVAGFAFGQRALSLTRPTVSGIPEESAFLWKLVPGNLELGTTDHVLHIVIGGIFLLGAYLTLRKVRPFNKVTWH